MSAKCHKPTSITYYSITSSARASTDGGTVRPSSFAVWRLITNSYLVGACTGRSAGFLALKDAVDVAGCATILAKQIGTIQALRYKLITSN